LYVRLVVLVLGAAAVSGKQVTLNSTPLSYDDAKAHCESQGQSLVSICNEEELIAVRATNIPGPVTIEYWIGLPAAVNQPGPWSMEQLSNVPEGDKCRILSNWESKPFSVYTKDCVGKRPSICQDGPLAQCPVPKRIYVRSEHVAYDDAKAKCESEGKSLLAICNEEELDAVRATNIPGPVTTEYWIGLPATVNQPGPWSMEQLSSVHEGDKCRILSNWESKPFSVYTKDCVGNRPYICQDGPLTPCPGGPESTAAPTAAPAPAPTAAPTPAPTAAPTPAPTAAPTEAPTAAPTAPPTIPPGVEVTKAEGPTTLPSDPTCTKQKRKFAAQGLPIEEPRLDDLCRFRATQCNADRCWCVNTRSGKVKGDGFSFPASETYHCIGRIRSCIRSYIAAIEKSPRPGYVPNCDKAGYYAPEQCDTDKNECWCAKQRGGEIKKSRVSGSSANC